MRNRFLCLVLLACGGLARPAVADPLVVTGGAFHLDIEADIFNLSGSGFTLSTVFFGGNYTTKLFNGRGDPTGGFPPSTCFACPEAEGQLVDWGFRTIGGEQLLGRGNATIDGLNASGVDFLGSMRFDAIPTQLRSGGTLDFEFVAPFVFSASIRGVREGQELFAHDFSGRGLVRVDYEATLRPGFFSADDETIDYEFSGAQTPEPASLLLLASGLGAAATKRRRRA